MQLRMLNVRKRFIARDADDLIIISKWKVIGELTVKNDAETPDVIGKLRFQLRNCQSLRRI